MCVYSHMHTSSIIYHMSNGYQLKPKFTEEKNKAGMRLKSQFYTKLGVEVDTTMM